jgi:hypothetical protein
MLNKIVLTKICKDCGILYDISDMTKTTNGLKCEECIEEYAPCKVCKVPTYIDELHNLEKGLVCIDCLNNLVANHIEGQGKYE